MAKFMLESEFYCTKCGNKGIPIVRRAGRGREAGHLKKLWCIYCKEEHNFCETKEFTHYSKEDFDLEFKYGNFASDGTRKMSYGEFRCKLNSEGLL